MHPRDPAQPSADSLKRALLMAILALGGAAAATGWAMTQARGDSSPVLRAVLGLGIVFHPTFLVVVWRRLLPLRVVGLSCLLFAAAVCAACLALRLYSSADGASIDLQPLFLWIPGLYVFAFTLSGPRSGLRISLALMAAFVAISVPYLAGGGDRTDANFTVQLPMVSALLIAALYVLSSQAHRFQAARLTLDELARLANTDELTQLANRRRIAEILESELARFARYGHAFSIILVDIDRFKEVHDRFGHDAGDRTLVALTARAADLLRDVDTLGRWSGEELVVVLPETPYEESLHKAHALCAHVSAQPLVGAHGVTVSCGVASVETGDSAETLLRRADEALHAAKRQGGNRAEGARHPEPDAASVSTSWADAPHSGAAHEALPHGLPPEDADRPG
jgi:diguanylate cyclase (GGDEF)-like protein